MDSGASRCQQASASATGLPSSVRYRATGRLAIRRDIGLRVTSWSQAATYQAFSGCGRTLLVVELVDETTVMVFLPELLRPPRGNDARGRWTRRKACVEQPLNYLST